MKTLTTLSDAGSVKIGNDNFSVLIPNGYGDGDTKVIIVSNIDCESFKSFKFFTSIKGNINIYNYDCDSPCLESKVIETIKGWYGVYYKDGTVLFEKWDR